MSDDPYSPDNGNGQVALFEVPANWEEEWQGMPEFIQGKQRPFAQLVIRFRNQADLKEFAELINQKLTRNTKSTWYPEITRGFNRDKKYVDDES